MLLHAPAMLAGSFGIPSPAPTVAMTTIATTSDWSQGFLDQRKSANPGKGFHCCNTMGEQALNRSLISYSETFSKLSAVTPNSPAPHRSRT